MNSLKCLLLITFSWISLPFYGQSPIALAGGLEQELFTLSSFGFAGSTRNVSLGGAHVVSGVDAGSTHFNPANLGYFTKSAIDISLESRRIKNESTLLTGLGSETTRNTSTVSPLRNFSVVFGFDKHEEEGGSSRAIVSGGFSIDYTQLTNFASNRSYQGSNAVNSLRNSLVNAANGTNFNVFADQLTDQAEVEDIFGLGYYTFVLNTISETSSDPALNSFYTTFNEGAVDLVEGETELRGRNQYWNIAYGLNVKDKWTIGLSVGIRSLRYTETSIYTETPQEIEDGIEQLLLIQNVVTVGQGVALSFGANYQLSKQWKVGFTYESGTRYELDREVSLEMIALFDSAQFGPFILDGPESQSTITSLQFITLRSPSRVSLGTSFDPNAWLSSYFTIGFTNYANITATQQDTITMPLLDRPLEDVFRFTPNWNVGFELKKGIGRGRLGVRRTNNPYQRDASVIDLSSTFLSLGVGILTEVIHLDIAISRKIANNETLLFSNQTNSPVLESRFSTIAISYSAGFFF